MKWLIESNRPKHIVYGFIGALVGTIFLSLGLAIGKEYSDKIWGGKFDWLDISATLIGGVIGQIVQLPILITLLHL